MKPTEGGDVRRDGTCTTPAPRLLFLVTEDWYFASHRLGLARRARDAGYEVIVGTRCNSHCAALAAEGFRVCPIPFDRSLRRPLADVRAWRAIRGVLARETPALVHLISLKPILLGALAAGRRDGPPLLLAFTGLGYIFSSGDRLAWLMRPLVLGLLRYLARARRAWLLTQNEDDRALLEAQAIGVTSRSRTIAGSGVDLAVYCPAPEPPGAQPLVILPARLLRDKGVHDFVAAARLVRARQPAARFALVGARDADNPAAISAAEVEAWLREGVIEWWGHRSDMPAVYHEATIVCLPSYREGLPKVLLEAAACERALIATDVPGCRDICRHEDTGLLVPPRAPRELATAIERLLGDTALRRRLAANARHRVEAHFALEQVAAETLDLYAEMRASAAATALAAG